ncbi:MAG: Xaa-Pro peptidase family protein [Pseudomonadota bacterium]
MALHFSRDEFADRVGRLQARLNEWGLDGALIFQPESMFYLTGYDTFGFCFFQCLYVGADGQIMLLTRAPDKRQAAHTSTVGDIRIWIDAAGADPVGQLRRELASLPIGGKRLGVEYRASGLNAYYGRQLDAVVGRDFELADFSEVVDEMRLVKSAAEMAYVERAAELSDAALDAAIATTRAGAFEGDILAAMQGAVFQGGGDYPGNEFVIGSGRDALLCRYFSGRRRLDPVDQLTLEFAGAYRHYHACHMRTIVVGSVSDRHRALHAAAEEALGACIDALRPGEPLGAVFDAHARTLDAAGLSAHRMNACGYSLGTTFAPVWMDPPMLYTGNPVIAAPNMVFFMHMIIADSDREVAMTLGQTVVVTATGSRRLSRHDDRLLTA